MGFTGNIAHAMMIFFTRKDYRTFLKHAGNPSSIQEMYLLSLLQRNAQTHFGNKHYFKKIRNISEFQDKIPVAGYEDFEGYIDKIAGGQNQVLSASKVLKLVPTSGTTGYNKFIPYTRDTIAEFNLALHVWMHDLYRQYPGLKKGRAFWSISPPGDVPHRQSVIPIGFEKDDSYFGKAGSRLINKTMAMPQQLQQVKDVQAHMQAMCLYLLATSDLNLISVWNPTYLQVLLQFITSNKSVLLQNMTDGVSTLNVLGLKFKADQKRARYLQSILHDQDPERTAWKEVWPDLQLISCWNNAWAASQTKTLQGMFENVPIQGKGLLATEGAVTIPVMNHHLPAYFSHFFEFSDTNGKIYLVHELQQGQTYDTIITTGSGLYRYRLNDLVKVNSFYKELPSLEFIGKSNVVSDMVGEKLSEPIVNKIIETIRNDFSITTGLIFLAPCSEKDNYFYTLFIQNEISDPFNLSEKLDEELSKVFYYARARSCNQLSAPRVYHIDQQGAEQYLSSLNEQNQQGVTKHLSLNRQVNLHEKLKGNFIL